MKSDFLTVAEAGQRWNWAFSKLEGRGREFVVYPLFCFQIGLVGIFFAWWSCRCVVTVALRLIYTHVFSSFTHTLCFRSEQFFMKFNAIP